MPKIKIRSNVTPSGLGSFSPECFDNIDVSYGVSFFCSADWKSKALEPSNSWGMKVLSKLDQWTRFLHIPATEKVDKEVSNAIFESANFIATHQPDESTDLQVQVNARSIFSGAVKYLTGREELDTRKYSLDPKAACVIIDDKQMFLGLNFFKRENPFFNSLTESFSIQDAVSFVFFHEYSHSAERVNNGNYGRQSWSAQGESSLDWFYGNLIKLRNSQGSGNFGKKIYESCPDASFNIGVMCKTLASLHIEIYADVGSLLLMRNKMILENRFSKEGFAKMVDGVCGLRRVEKTNAVKQESGFHDDPHLRTNHFTAPGVEALDRILDETLASKSEMAILSPQEIHEISARCVKEGIGKTLLALVETDNMAIPVLNSLFSAKVVDRVDVIDTSKNYYREAMQIIKEEIVPKEWQDGLSKRVQMLRDNGLDVKSSAPIRNALLFDAALDPAEFEKGFNNQLKLIKKIDDIIGATVKRVSGLEFDIPPNYHQADISSGLVVNKIQAMRAKSLLQNHKNTNSL